MPTLLINVGAKFACYPQEDNLALADYSHVEVSITDDSKPILPSEAHPELAKFDVYFSDGKAECLAVVIANELADKFRDLCDGPDSEPAPEPTPEPAPTEATPEPEAIAPAPSEFLPEPSDGFSRF